MASLTASRIPTKVLVDELMVTVLALMEESAVKVEPDQLPNEKTSDPAPKSTESEAKLSKTKV